MLLFISLAGILAALILAVYGIKYFKGNIYLALFFLFNSIYSLTSYGVYFSPGYTLGALLNSHLMPVLYLPGPFLYLYIRSVFSNNYRLKVIDSAHLLPFVILFIGIVPYLFVDFDVKINLIKYIREDISYMLTQTNSIIPQRVNLLSRPVLIMAYLIAALNIVLKNNSQKKRDLSNSVLNSSKIFQWISLLLYTSLVLFFFLALFSILALFSDNPNRVIEQSSWMIGVVIFCYFIMNISIFFIPDLLYGMSNLFPKANRNPLSATNQANDDVFQASLESKLNLFTEEYLSSLDGKIEICIKDKLFLNPDFDMDFLSNYTKIPVHHISYYFNHVINIKFVDWRNNFRIIEATNLMNAGAAASYTLDAIGRTCGFTNKGTFISSFKKYTGKTPGEFFKTLELNPCIEK
ncbi:MAG: AraC family transcriptional regulator [Prolixibacteraceae bacterium]|nr:AraC family transcriptional regulator [Prolixibacteraceae bacterium]